MSNHRSYYINVGQILGLGVTGYLGWRALRLEEAKAGIQHRPVMEVIKDDARKFRNWWTDTFVYRNK